jgi:hypothetical protein
VRKIPQKAAGEAMLNPALSRSSSARKAEAFALWFAWFQQHWSLEIQNFQK